MANTGMIGAMALAATLAASAAAGQTLEQQQNRYQLQESRRALDRNTFEQRLQQNDSGRALQDRVNRQALERQLNTPRLQHLPPAGSLQRY